MYKLIPIVNNITKGGTMNTIYKIALVLVIIGALNWGLVGLFDVNLVSLIFGVDSLLSNIVYVLVGIAGIVSCGILMQPLDEETRHRVLKEHR